MIYKKSFYNTLLIVLLVFVFSERLLGQSDKPIELMSIDFIGNDYFDSDELAEIIVSKESSSWFSQFFNSFTSFGSPPSYFDSLNIPDDISIIKNFYKSKGYFKPIIRASYSIYENDNREADLWFNITENNPSFIRNYNIEGLDSLPRWLYSELLEEINIDSTNQYSEELIETNSNNIIVFLQDKGYMLAQLSTPIVDIDTMKNAVDVTVNINLGNRYRISNVRVDKSGPGEKLVSSKLIKDIANITPEKFYKYSELKLAQIRLYRTNLFSSAVITGNVSDTSRNYVPIDIITKVGLLNEFSPEIIGINEESRFKLGLGLTYSNKNFLGDARKLTISTSAAAQNITEFIKKANLASDNIFGYADARIGIEQPFIFGKPINTRLETFYTLEKKKNQWNASIYGAKLNLDFELPPFIYVTSLSTYFTWQNSKYIYQDEYLTQRLSKELLDLLKSKTTKNTSAILGVQLVANKTDDFLYPTSGYSLTFLAEDGNAIPLLISQIGNYTFKQTAYYKLALTTTVYFPYLKNIFDSFGMKLKIGNIRSYHGSLDDIPYNQRLTAGGSNSIRGWGANDLPITDTVLTSTITPDEIENLARNITPGGFFLFEGSIEGREHLSEKVGIALFLDYGNVWRDFDRFRYDELAVAAGFGFRYYSDFAPIRLDFGFKAYNPDDRRSFFKRLRHSPFLDNIEFQIGIGEAF